MDPLIQILKRLDDHGARFVLIGGMAAIAHGSPMMTTDVDVCAPLDDENLAKIIDALRPLNPRWRFRPDKWIPVDQPERFRGFKNLYITTDAGTIDILGEVPGIGPFEEIATRTVELDLETFRCRVLDIDTLIAAKTVAGRDKDRIGVRHLEVIKQKRENPGQPSQENVS